MVKVKVCGLTNFADYRIACDLGADWAGFIFYQKSPRFISPERARRVIKRGRFSVVKVGVFVNEPIARVREVFNHVGLDIVQLHGDEDPAYGQALGLPYWKVIRVKGLSSLEEMENYSCETFLLDACAGISHGGAGKAIDFSVLQKALGMERKIIVAGGVSVETVEQVISLRPFGVDVCSSLEEYPGKKSEQKMREFFQVINKWRETK